MKDRLHARIQSRRDDALFHALGGFGHTPSDQIALRHAIQQMPPDHKQVWYEATHQRRLECEASYGLGIVLWGMVSLIAADRADIALVLGMITLTVLGGRLMLEEFRRAR